MGTLFMLTRMDLLQELCPDFERKTDDLQIRRYSNYPGDICVRSPQLGNRRLLVAVDPSAARALRHLALCGHRSVPTFSSSAAHLVHRTFIQKVYLGQHWKLLVMLNDSHIYLTRVLRTLEVHMGRRAYALFVAVANLLSHLSAYQNAYVCPHNCTAPSSQMKCLKCPKNISKVHDCR